MENNKTIIIEDNKQAEFENKTVQTANTAKELSQDGIDLITQGTNLKAKADKLLIEGREVMSRAEESFNQADSKDNKAADITATINTLNNKLQAEMEEQASLEAKLLESRKIAKELKDNLDTNSRDLKITQADAASAHSISEQLKERANKLLGEGAASTEESEKLINKGNDLLEESKRLTNSTQEKLAGHATTEFIKAQKEDLRTNEFTKEEPVSFDSSEEVEETTEEEA